MATHSTTLVFVARRNFLGDSAQLLLSGAEAPAEILKR